VRSAYHLEQQHRSQAAGESSSQQENSEFWTWLWNLKAPGTLKNFVWRVAHDLLPTREVLFRRHVTDNPFCPICSREPESLFNILWQCSSSMAVWQEGCRRVQKLSWEETDGRGFLQQLRARLNGEELLETLILARLIWLRRNSLIFNRSFSDPASIISHARDIMSTFTEVHLRSPESGLPHSQARWERPPLGWKKINWDAALEISNRRVGIGLVVRNDAGDIEAASTVCIPFVTDPTLAEALGAWHALLFCRKQRYTHVILEGDSQEVVKALRKEGPCWMSYGHIIEDTRSCFQFINPLEVNFVRREANRAAHVMAQYAISSQLNHVWMGECPPFIRNIVVSETFVEV
jgi:ribonuclease HI